MPKVAAAAAGGGHRHNNTTCSWSGRCRRGDLLLLHAYLMPDVATNALLLDARNVSAKEMAYQLELEAV